MAAFSGEIASFEGAKCKGMPQKLDFPSLLSASFVAFPLFPSFLFTSSPFSLRLLSLLLFLLLLPLLFFPLCLSTSRCPSLPLSAPLVRPRLCRLLHPFLALPASLAASPHFLPPVHPFSSLSLFSGALGVLPVLPAFCGENRHFPPTHG